MRLIPCLILALVVVASGCGGKSTPPKSAPADAGQAQPGGQEPFDPNAATKDAQPVPPFFPPGTDGESQARGATVEKDVPGPLGKGIIEADGVARLILAKDGTPTLILKELPVHLHLEARRSPRGHEILASIRTPEPKIAGGFLYLTTSTGGNDAQKVAPVPSAKVDASKGDDGLWHYGANAPGVTMGLLNVKDLLAKLTTPPTEKYPETVNVDQFEGAIVEDLTGFIITGAGNLPDGRRMVLTAKATRPPVVAPPTPPTAPAMPPGAAPAASPDAATPPPAPKSGK